MESLITEELNSLSWDVFPLEISIFFRIRHTPADQSNDYENHPKPYWGTSFLISPLENFQSGLFWPNML